MNLSTNQIQSHENIFPVFATQSKNYNSTFFLSLCDPTVIAAFVLQKLCDKQYKSNW